MEFFVVTQRICRKVLREGHLFEQQQNQTKTLMKKILLVASIALASLGAVAAPSGNIADGRSAAPVAEKATVAAADKGEIAIMSETVVMEAQKAAPSDAVRTPSKKLTREQKNRRIEEADPHGYGVTIMSMAIVICALIILSILFVLFGKLSQRMHNKRKMEAQGLVKGTSPKEVASDSGEVIAAISLALHEHFNARHDIEETVLTIKKLKRAYSPWSSKIYNLRAYPMRNIWNK